jgi:hypothetical protein
MASFTLITSTWCPEFQALGSLLVTARAPFARSHRTVRRAGPVRMLTTRGGWRAATIDDGSRYAFMRAEEEIRFWERIASAAAEVAAQHGVR